MAPKKPKTPPPPARRVQAPRQRKDGKRADEDRGRKLLYAFSGAGIVALVVVVAVIAFAGRGSSAGKHDAQVASLMAAAGCTFRSVKASVPGGQTHIQSLTKPFPWNTTPPASGPHYPLWAVWGFYNEPINPRMVVHNEEHGGVVFWWGSKVPQSTVQKLHDLYDKEPTGMFGTPYPSLGNKIAITAWTGNPATYQRNGDFGVGHIAKCSSYGPKTEKAILAFRDTFRGHGPEGIPLSQDEPGMGPQTQ